MTALLAVAVFVTGVILLRNPNLGWKDYVFAGSMVVSLVCSMLFDREMYLTIVMFVIEPLALVTTLTMLVLIARDGSQKSKKGK